MSCTLPRLPAPTRIESIQTLKACLPARAALSAFSQALKQCPVGSIAAESFSMLDAVGAVQLEGVPLEAQVALQFKRLTHHPELQRHVDARQEAHSRLVHEPVSSTLALELASVLHEVPVSVRRGDAKSSESILTQCQFGPLPAPQGAEKLQALLEDWHGFVQCRAADLDPLLMVAAAHGQWMALRPFTDANIGLGQLLTALLLSEEDLLPHPALPLALYFSRHAETYWRNLHAAVVHGDHASWFQFFMTATQEAAVDATEQLMQWQGVVTDLTETMHMCMPKTPSEALITTCARPSFGLADLAQAGLTRRQTASSWMQNLVDQGVIEEIRAGKEKRYLNKHVMAVLLP